MRAMYYRSLNYFVISIIALVTVGCFGRNRDSSAAVAKVGDEILTERDLSTIMLDDINSRGSSEARWSAAERWVNRELLYREALRRGVDADPKVARQLKTAEREILINALIQTFYVDELTVAEDEIVQYYEEHRALFRRAETSIHVRQIVLDNSTEARAVERQLRRSPGDFEEIARRQSSDPSAADGGDLGYVTASTVYNQEIWQALLRLNDGEISRSISTDFGWHILKKIESRPEGSFKSLDEVRLEIINRIRATKRWTITTELVERLKLQESYVFYADRLGPREFQYQEFPSAGSLIDDIDAHE